MYKSMHLNALPSRAAHESHKVDYLFKNYKEVPKKFIMEHILSNWVSLQAPSRVPYSKKLVHMTLGE